MPKGWFGSPEGHAAAGKIGGKKVSEDHAHMSEIGKRGGLQSALKRNMGEMARMGAAARWKRSAMAHTSAPPPSPKGEEEENR